MTRHVGQPHEVFPHHWSVLEWIDGSDAVRRGDAPFIFAVRMLSIHFGWGVPKFKVGNDSRGAGDG